MALVRWISQVALEAVADGALVDDVADGVDAAHPLPARVLALVLDARHPLPSSASADAVAVGHALWPAGHVGVSLRVSRQAGAGSGGAPLLALSVGAAGIGVARCGRLLLHHAAVEGVAGEARQARADHVAVHDVAWRKKLGRKQIIINRPKNIWRIKNLSTNVPVSLK